MADDMVEVAENSARGGFFLVSGTALATVVTAISAILIGRLLGPELYGQYILAFVIPQLLYLFTDLGINQGVTKFTASFNAKKQTNRLISIVKNALLLKTLAGVALFIVNYAFAETWATTFLQRPDLAYYIRIASFSIPCQVIITTAQSAFVGLDKSEYSAVATNVQAFTKTLVSIPLVILGLGVAGAVTGQVLSFTIAAMGSAAILFLVLRRRSDKTDDSNSLGDVRGLVSYALPLYVSILLTGFIPVFQSFILAIFTTDADIGNYNAASNFATLITVLSIPITTALLPAFSKIDSSATMQLRSFFRIANKYIAILITPVTVLLITYSVQVVQIVYGSTFQSAPLFLATYISLYFLAGLGYLTLKSFYNGLGETRITFVMSLVIFLIVIGISPPLTQVYGVQGMIATFLLASLVGTLYGIVRARKKFMIEFDRVALLKIYAISFASSIPSILMLNLLKLPNILSFSAGCVLYIFIYITLMPVSGIVTQNELRMVSNIIQRIRLLKIIVKPIIIYQRKILSKNN